MAEEKYDTTQLAFEVTEKIAPRESGIYFYYSPPRLRANPKLMKRPVKFLVHEFSECSVIAILERWKIDWRREVKYDDFPPVRVPHFISPFGKKGTTIFSDWR
ncbi:MAG: hypothetical protein ACTSV6_07775 [Candidatus Heimdallarchaeota archaeon]